VERRASNASPASWFYKGNGVDVSSVPTHLKDA